LGFEIEGLIEREDRNDAPEIGRVTPPPAGQLCAGCGLRVRGDEGKLRQALTNLLGNAVKFTTTGEVRLRVVGVACDPSEANIGQPSGISGQSPMSTGRKSCFRFEVVDTGPGIASELQARLFQPFQQGNAESDLGGTGLGLAITRRFAETMGGRVGVESTVGQGSRFWIEIPLAVVESESATLPVIADGGATAKGANRPPRLAAGVSVRALVVDDVKENRDILSMMLRQFGCEVEVAAGGFEALDRLRAKVPEIVFLDIRMPGMDGMETLCRMKAELETPVRGEPSSGLRRPPRFVAVSASALGHERDRCLTSGFDAFLGKPFLVAELVEVIGRLLEVRWEIAAPEGAEGEAVKLPAGLRERLVASARGYRVTELKQGLAEVESFGAAGVVLATRLRRLAQVSQMAEVIRLLAEVPDISASDEPMPSGPAGHARGTTSQANRSDLPP
jgi:CheY-like chemotaxis protein